MKSLTKIYTERRRSVENATYVNQKRMGGTLEITFDLQKAMKSADALSKGDPGTDKILKRIVLGRGLQYYMAGNPKFEAGSDLLMKLRDAANELQVISNNVYVTGHAVQQALRVSTQCFDRVMMEVIRFVESVDGGKQELKEVAGVNIDQLSKMFGVVKPARNRLKMIILKLLL